MTGSTNYPAIRKTFVAILCLAILSLAIALPVSAQIDLQTRYLRIHVDTKGFITSLRNRQTNEEYSPTGHPSPLLALWAGNAHILPNSAKWTPGKNELLLTYANGSIATVKVRQTPEYLRLELASLSNRGDIDNIVWGPVNTTISTKIGDLIGVVRNGKFALGMLALNDITISGEPCDGDMAGMYYYVHSSDPKKFPVAPPYKEGQTYHIGGDGVNDVAFYSHPEEYFHMKGGNAAELQPAFGASLCMHARDRRKPYTYLFTLIPGFTHVNEARHQVTDTLNSDFIGSAVALYGCPDAQGSHLIEDIVLAEGLPHPTVNGKWVKDPDAFRPDMAWYGNHDSTISYARRLNLKGIQDEELGEYYVNPADRWAGKRIRYSDGRQQTIREFTDEANQYGILYGLHTLCEFIQPHSSDVHPIPYQHLQTVLRTQLASDISATDTLIALADTSFLNEHGTWHDNAQNTLRIGNELLTYNGVTTQRPYTLLGVKRGIYKTEATPHKTGDELAKLQMNCYQGFAPDIKGERDYADFYAKLMVDGGMNFVDFDGMESCMYQNQGYFSFKTFFGRLYDTYHKLGGKYLRITGSTVTEGSWHYESICDVGGGDHMFSPVLNKWGIEGKDMRDMFEYSYFPATFGIVSLDPAWSVYDAENLQAKSIGWKATYMLGLSQHAVENCGEKEAIFTAFRAWEDARETGAFSEAQKLQLKDLNFKFHLERKDDGTFALSPIRETRFDSPIAPDSLHPFAIENPYATQPLEMSARLQGKKGARIQGLSWKLGNAGPLQINDTLAAGEFVLVKGGKIFLADHNRKIRKEITPSSTGSGNNSPMGGYRLPAGKTSMDWSIKDPSDNSLKLEVVVSAIGSAQRVGKPKQAGSQAIIKQATPIKTGISKRPHSGSPLVLNNVLNSIKAICRVSAKQYEGVNPLHEQILYPATEPRHPNDNRGVWQTRIETSAVPGEKEAVDAAVNCKVISGTPLSTGLSVSFDLSAWSAANFVMVPAVVYNGNRYSSIGNGYNPPYPKEMYYNPAIPIIISNDPRLKKGKEDSSRIELQTGNASTPAFCFFLPALQKGVIILSSQNTRLGNNGLTISENAAKDHCSFQIESPCMRKQSAGFGDFHPSEDKAPDWQTGDQLTLAFRIYVFPAKNIPATLTKFIQVRKAFSGPNHPRNTLPMSKQFESGIQLCKARWSENPAGSYYLPENNHDFQLGWTSGMINTYAMLALDDAQERERVATELDFVIRKLQGPSGFFYGGITADGRIQAEKMNPAFPAVQAMVRKNCDALLWFIKHLLLLRAQGHPNAIKPAWESAVRRLATAFVNTWDRYGQFGQYIVPEDGKIAVFNSMAGAIAPAGLALAAEYFREPAFLRVAKASANYYYQKYIVSQGFAGGSCGDISQDADSESAFGFLESLMGLYAATKEPAWLEKAKVEAALCSSWTLSYDARFPPKSTIGNLDAHMAGAVWASIQNKHAAPGICEASGDYLFKLYRATGDPLYADLIRDIEHANAEMVNMPGHITTNYRIGSSMERIQLSDAEGWGSVGKVLYTENSWTETNGVLMDLELPGIYIRTDTRKIYVFDHILATPTKEKASGFDLVLENPTSYDANVSIFAETGKQAATPMGYTGFLKWPKITLAAGEKKILHIGPSGKPAI